MKYADLLYAPDMYWKLTKAEKSEICNGVGPKGLGWLFPNTNWLLDMSEAADIHDYMYNIGESLNDKREADNIFLENLILIINRESRYEWVRKRRLCRAELMFQAVDKFGESAFFANKD